MHHALKSAVISRIFCALCALKNDVFSRNSVHCALKNAVVSRNFVP